MVWCLIVATILVCLWLWFHIRRGKVAISTVYDSFSMTQETISWSGDYNFNSIGTAFQAKDGSKAVLSRDPASFYIASIRDLYSGAVHWSAATTGFGTKSFAIVGDYIYLGADYAGKAYFSKISLDDWTETRIKELGTTANLNYFAATTDGNDTIYYAYMGVGIIYVRKYVISTSTDSSVGDSASSYNRLYGLAFEGTTLYLTVARTVGSGRYRLTVAVSGGTPTEDSGPTTRLESGVGGFISGTTGAYYIKSPDLSKTWAVDFMYGFILNSDSYPIKVITGGNGSAIYWKCIGLNADQSVTTYKTFSFNTSLVSGSNAEGLALDKSNLYKGNTVDSSFPLYILASNKIICIKSSGAEIT